MRMPIIASIAPVRAGLLRVVLLIVVMTLTLSWRATTAHAATPNHPEVFCGGRRLVKRTKANW